MSINRSALPTKMVAIYQAGVSPDSGAPIIRRKTFSNVRPEATDQDIHEVMAAFFALLQYPLLDVERDDCFLLTEED